MTTELGPVDYVVVELPTGASSVYGDVCAELTGLVDNHLVRVLDLLLITRGADGTVSVAEFEDMTRDGLGSLAGSLVELLSLEDVENLATTIAPGLSGLAIVWEYTCTEPFFSAVTRPVRNSPRWVGYPPGLSSPRCGDTRSSRELDSFALSHSRFRSRARSTASRRDDTPSLR
ncbi:DUF6325 family protein [Gordonia terrae]|uniref:DUF6325 family protein n=1 Tax=Gordonia terrae TaxID=2055 RepID=UPI00200B9797|nr:DUF6325 family protein [Gordonia terrae]UPW09365.1 DUF6325 family protein [Gordonia terrae]